MHVPTVHPQPQHRRLPGLSARPQVQRHGGCDASDCKLHMGEERRHLSAHRLPCGLQRVVYWGVGRLRRDGAAVQHMRKGAGVRVSSLRDMLAVPARLLQALRECERLLSVPRRHVQPDQRRPERLCMPAVPGASVDAGPHRPDQPGCLQMQ